MLHARPFRSRTDLTGLDSVLAIERLLWSGAARRYVQERFKSGCADALGDDVGPTENP